MTIATMPILASPAHADSPDQIELIKDALARVPERYGTASAQPPYKCNYPEGYYF